MHKIFTRSLPTLALLGAACGLANARDPVLATPGTAKWATEKTATGSRTVFTLKANTVFDWENLNVPAGSELVFNFVGGKNVLNFLHGSDPHVINGSVTSNGRVAFFSPTADLEVNGSITAKSVVLSTLNADAAEFNAGGNYHLNVEKDFRILSVDGTVNATQGNLTMAGERVEIGANGRLQGSDGIRVGGGRHFTVAATGDKRLKETSGRGSVSHLGVTQSPEIEIVSGGQILNQGSLDARSGKVFLSVGPGGNITNDSTGIIFGNPESTGAYSAIGKVYKPNEGDTVPVVSDGTLSLPKLRRPDGSRVSTPATLSYSVPMSASGDAGRDSSAVEPSRKGEVRVAGSKSLLQRSSFFGMRGGSAAATKPDR